MRSVKLTILPGKYDANGHRAVKCLVWDKNTEVFIEQSLSCLQSLESQECQRFGDSDIEFSMSAMSESGTASMGENQTSQTLKNQCLHPEIHVSTGQPDIADNADVPLGEKNKIRCGYCQHFFLSPNAPGGRGSCHTVSWNEKTTQLSDDLHTCANFKRAEADDLRKVVI